MVDEWRVCTKKIVTESIPMENVPVNSIMDFAKLIPFGDVLTDMNTCEKVDKEAFTIEPEIPLSKIPETSKSTLKLPLETIDDNRTEEVSNAVKDSVDETGHSKKD